MGKGLKASPYIDKHSPWSSHSIIASRLKRMDHGSKVLDVGSATGTLGRLCRDSDLILYGIEPVPEWMAKASFLYREVRCCTLEKAEDSFLSGYDCIVCADILEHLTNPENALSRLVALQSAGSLFILSVPNVANLWVRLNLLFGRFNYAERGILDRTHLRFFTRKTLLEMLDRVNLKVTKIWATPIPLELVSTAFQERIWGQIIYRLLAILTNTFPTIFGYQFVVEASKRNG
jgi:2-polyprenyl-3-methyl-5-hydroxy-6-metoxy-1,4-benzoquinol methylase